MRISFPCRPPQKLKALPSWMSWLPLCDPLPVGNKNTSGDTITRAPRRPLAGREAARVAPAAPAPASQHTVCGP